MADRISSLLAFLAIVAAAFIAQWQEHPITAIFLALIGIVLMLYRIERHLARGAEFLELATRPEKDDEHG